MNNCSGHGLPDAKANDGCHVKACMPLQGDCCVKTLDDTKLHRMTSCHVSNSCDFVLGFSPFDSFYFCYINSVIFRYWP